MLWVFRIRRVPVACSVGKGIDSGSDEASVFVCVGEVPVVFFVYAYEFYRKFVGLLFVGKLDMVAGLGWVRS